MNDERYNALMDSGLLGKPLTSLTQEEINKGWHFCEEWDLLLIGPGFENCELDCCHCFPAEHPIYSYRTKAPTHS